MRSLKIIVLLCAAAFLMLGASFVEDDQFPVQESERLPVYKVTRSGPSASAAGTLLQLLRVEGMNRAVDQNGLVEYVNREQYLFVPTRRVGTGEADEEKENLVLEAPNIDAIKQMQPIDANQAMAHFREALEKSELLPEGGYFQTTYTSLNISDLNHRTLAEAKVSTQVNVRQSLNGVQLVGPGARICVTYARDGSTTSLRYASRSVERGVNVSVISRGAIANRYTEMLKRVLPEPLHEGLRVNAQLVYYAPPLEMRSVQEIIPHYLVGGTFRVGEDEFHLMDRLIPATTNSEFVPTVELEAGIQGTRVTARANVSGGRPPYSYEWCSSHGQVEGKDNAVSYDVDARGPATREVVSVFVTDANGVCATASQVLQLRVLQRMRIRQPTIRQPHGPALAVEPPVDAAGQTPVLVGGVRDFGTEDSVTNQFGHLEADFVTRMQSDGVTKRFQWCGSNAWEQDFKANGDSNYIDNTDITFYVGHGGGGGFTFEDTTHTDHKLDYDDATGDWGDKDLEWLALYSCQVLRDSWSGMNRFQRWKQEFDGLHLLLGFHTNAAVDGGFSGAFARNMLTHRYTVLRSWTRATDSNQPNDRVCVIMGVLRRGDWVWNYNDHFWGKGSVGPDIRGDNIGGYWTLTHNAQ